jgi:hypothetical protein
LSIGLPWEILDDHEPRFNLLRFKVYTEGSRLAPIVPSIPANWMLLMHCHLEQRTATLNPTTICKGACIVHEHDIVKIGVDGRIAQIVVSATLSCTLIALSVW